MTDQCLVQDRRQVLGIAAGKISHLIVPEVAGALTRPFDEFRETVAFTVASQRAAFQRQRWVTRGGAEKLLLVRQESANKVQPAVRSYSEVTGG